MRTLTTYVAGVMTLCSLNCVAFAENQTFFTWSLSGQARASGGQSKSLKVDRRNFNAESGTSLQASIFAPASGVITINWGIRTEEFGSGQGSGRHAARVSFEELRSQRVLLSEQVRIFAGDPHVIEDSNIITVAALRGETYILKAAVDRSSTGWEVGLRGSFADISATYQVTEQVSSLATGQTTLNLVDGAQVLDTFEMTFPSQVAATNLSNVVLSIPSWTVSDPSIQNRVQVWAEVTSTSGAKVFGQIKVRLNNSQGMAEALPAADPITVTQRQLRFSNNDSEGDQMASFVVEIFQQTPDGLDSIFSSDEVVSSEGVFEIPDTLTLFPDVEYSWSIRTKDIFAASDGWGESNAPVSLEYRAGEGSAPVAVQTVEGAVMLSYQTTPGERFSIYSAPRPDGDFQPVYGYSNPTLQTDIVGDGSVFRVLVPQSIGDQYFIRGIER